MNRNRANRRTRAIPIAVLALLAGIGVWPADLAADSFRCGRNVVRTGDSTSLLLEKCGEPRFRDRSYESVRLDGARKSLKVERWHYKQGSRRLARAVLIYRGRIVGIETGER